MRRLTATGLATKMIRWRLTVTNLETAVVNGDEPGVKDDELGRYKSEEAMGRLQGKELCIDFFE